MKSLISLLLTGAVLLLGVALLMTDRLEYCGQPASLRPRAAADRVSAAGRPTLAPPQKVVLVSVEADLSDIEIGWVEK